jgi:hypothetical protein
MKVNMVGVLSTEYRIFKPVEVTIRKGTEVERRKIEEMNQFGL